MIETGLVYVHSIRPTKRFVGCGAVIEYGYIATCRHVWRMATEAAAKQHPDQSPEVEIEYPGSWKDGATVRQKATLAALCERSDGPAPDLVLLMPEAIPSGVEALRLASQERFETGQGFVRAGLKGLDETRPTGNDVRDIEIRGEIASLTGFDGRRQFTGTNPMSYWSTLGASGSPVFREGGEQLAGI